MFAAGLAVPLPGPGTDGGLPLMQARACRRRARAFGFRKLDPQTLSDLLQVAFGVNRPESGLRTAPSAHNAREISIFIAMEDGLFVYAPVDHTLLPGSALDLHAVTGAQVFVARAALNRICVAELARTGGASDEHLM